MLPANKFEPNVDYDSPENIISIIDSTMIKDRKSGGQPHQANGLATIGDIIAAKTKTGLVEMVVNDWESTDYQLKPFIKAGPEKVKKLLKHMPRIVAGMPVEQTIRNMATMKELIASVTENWTDSRIKYSFNAAKPGHIDHLAKQFKDKEVYESDKPNWDLMFFEYLFKICRETYLRMAVKPETMSDERFAKWKVDYNRLVDNVIYHAKYRCTNGKVFTSDFYGMMVSGWFGTISFNSLGQLAAHVLTMMRMGLSNDSILSDDYYILAGGDDTLQTFPKGFDHVGYIATALEMGIVMGEFVIHPQFSGCEFFSTKLFKKDGVWQFHPVRFTKHIAMLTTTKVEDLAGSLASLMQLYCWDEPKFHFLKRMFMQFRTQHPSHFDLVYYKGIQELRFKALGCEASC